MIPYHTAFQDLALSAAQLLRSILEVPRWLSLSSDPLPAAPLSRDALGVNVAPGRSVQVDDYTLARLDELGIRHVRIDLSYCGIDANAEGLLGRMLDNGFAVLLNLFPPQWAAQRMASDPDVQSAWREFVDDIFARYRGRVQYFEIGNTPNRGRWSGFSSQGFVKAWEIAAEAAGHYGVTLAGPNASDFEPLYNATYLGIFQHRGVAPAMHTDNLFVERVLEPEAYDHRALGRALRRLARLNLIKKARVLHFLGARRGASTLVCSYNCWSSKRLARRSAWPEVKQADYLVRYLALALASGALKRVYWGPLICSRDGLIDDRCTDYPEIDQVSFYQQVRGDLPDFRICDAYRALAQVVRRFASASRIETLHHDAAGLSMFRLAAEGSEEPYYLLWCRDTQSVPLTHLLPEEDLATAHFESACGDTLPPQVAVTEHPLYIRFSRSVDLQPARAASFTPGYTRHFANTEYQTIDWQSASWRGGLTLRRDQLHDDLQLADALTPDQLSTAPELRVLRDVRNRLWCIHDPAQRWQELTVKLNRVKGHKRFTYRFRPSKGRRHWNNACAMLRRGIATPTPVAWFEHGEKPGIRDSWYLCEYIPDAFSARDVYAALRDGIEQYRGLDKAQWFGLIAGFVCTVHNKQVLHRDLSAGNLMLKSQVDGTISPMLIDIGRARIWDGPGSNLKPRHRLQDLIRIAYKLNWVDRAAFIAQYEQAMGRSLPSYWRIPFHYYDKKQAFKKALKGRRKRRAR
ncbi:lipopolysaccharide kinase InaA family protein [Parahaliea aestuarii]|uniref:Protein kinase domain-containing protein n=1 Tax=Parahaliea aestuarii TaxID=1852021 RepID=A0A5C9A2J6_9GAMM|nr:lipopolysaccharide kinase InaA family protein [Parahaliea aestuarii]TXS95103.1 hypothetical protein FVW59_04185 [Parahaliea aestuarii]